MQRIDFQSDAYLIANPPPGVSAERLADAVRLAAAKTTKDQGPPQAIVWDGLVSNGKADPIGRVRFETGAVDDLLLSQIDARECCAILESAWKRVRERGLIQRGMHPGEALALLSRDPRFRVARADGATGAIEVTPRPKDKAMRPALQPELISVVLLAGDAPQGVPAFLDALDAQKLASRTEALVLTSGLERKAARELQVSLEARFVSGQKLRVFNLPGEMSTSTLANTAVSLANGEAVVIAHPMCHPAHPRTVQLLAGWVMGADILSASPRIIDNAKRLLSAGLTVQEGAGGALAMRPWNNEALTDVIRRASAPAPWFLAVNRKAWLSAGGADPRADKLWTASLSRQGVGHASGGRHLLIGSMSATWVDDGPPPGSKGQAKVSELSHEAARATRLVDDPTVGKRKVIRLNAAALAEAEDEVRAGP